MKSNTGGEIATRLDTKTSPIKLVDEPRIGLMRLVLALSALCIVYLDPAEPDRLVSLTYAALVVYTVYSALLYVTSYRQSARLRGLRLWDHWLDISWYTLFIALSSGTSSVFFFFYFFAILVASFRWGFSSGWRITLASSLLFTVVGYLTAPSGLDFELNRFLLRPTYLTALGYMMAYWGGFEISLNRRLELLRQMSILSNPRLGVEQTINSFIERLRDFFEAKSCLLIATDDQGEQYRLRHTGQGKSEEVINETLPTELRTLLLKLPDNVAALYADTAFRGWGNGPSYLSYDVRTEEKATQGKNTCQMLAAALDAASFITVPLQYHNQMIGRLYLTRLTAFHETDLYFLRQVAQQIMPVIENIRLVDRLASDAARQERQKISRDIHDSVIQPYIGFQIGLAALKEKYSLGGFDLKSDIDLLLQTTSAEIGELRRYIHQLRNTGDHENYFLPAVQRFAERFAEMTGLAIAIHAEKGFRISDRLAAEAFKMVEEGLSNVRRHTKATEVWLKFSRCNNTFFMEIENNVCSQTWPTKFVPKSIAGRAKALGGQVYVEVPDGRTRVTVEIPL